MTSFFSEPTIEPRAPKPRPWWMPTMQARVFTVREQLFTMWLGIVLLVCSFVVGSLGREQPCGKNEAYVVGERACVPLNAVVPAR